jgi:hypothetical protein
MEVKVQGESDNPCSCQHRVDLIRRIFRLELGDADALVARSTCHVQGIHHLRRHKIIPENYLIISYLILYQSRRGVGDGKLRAAGKFTRALVDEDCVLDKIAPSALAQADHRDPEVGRRLVSGVQNKVVAFT